MINTRLSASKGAPPRLVLAPCPRCGFSMESGRGVVYYMWAPYISCTNPRCRIRMGGQPYGNNGLINPRDKSYDGEAEAFAELAKRWNEGGSEDVREVTPDRAGRTAV